MSYYSHACTTSLSFTISIYMNKEAIYHNNYDYWKYINVYVVFANFEQTLKKFRFESQWSRIILFKIVISVKFHSREIKILIFGFISYIQDLKFLFLN